VYGFLFDVVTNNGLLKVSRYFGLFRGSIQNILEPDDSLRNDFLLLIATSNNSLLKGGAYLSHSNAT